MKEKKRKARIMKKSISKTEGNFIQVHCVSRGYHLYRQVWRPRLNQKLVIKAERNNLYEPYAMDIYAQVPGKITDKTLVGHILREISRFSNFYARYGDVISAKVRQTMFRISPLPQGGLEIPIYLCIQQGERSGEIYNQIKNYVVEYYMEPEKIAIKEEHQVLLLMIILFLNLSLTAETSFNIFSSFEFKAIRAFPNSR